MNVRLVTLMVGGAIAAGALGLYLTASTPEGAPLVEEPASEPVMALAAKVAPQGDAVETAPEPEVAESPSERPAPQKKPRHSRRRDHRLSDVEGRVREECVARLATSQLTEQQKKRRCRGEMKKAKRESKRAVFACEDDSDCTAARDACGWWKAVNAEHKEAFERDGARHKSNSLCKRRPRDEGPAPAVSCNTEKKRCVQSKPIEDGNP